MGLTCLSHEGNLDFSLLRVEYDLGFQQVNSFLKYYAGSVVVHYTMDFFSCTATESLS